MSSRMNGSVNRLSARTSQILGVTFLGLLGVALSGASGGRQGESKMSESLQKEFINESRGFTNVVAVTHQGLRTVHVSGQVGWAPDAGEPGADLAEQAKIAFENLDRQLGDAGVTREDVIKLNVFVKDIDPDKVRIVGGAQAQSFRTEKFPAATWVGVTGLVDPRLLVEIEAVAVVVAP